MQEALSKYPDLLVGLTVVGLGSESAKKGLGLVKYVTDAVQQGYRTVINNPQRTLWIVLLIAALTGALYWRASRYSHGPKCELMSWTLPLAKGCGQMIKVTTTLILLPVSRTTMTWLRWACYPFLSLWVIHFMSMNGSACRALFSFLQGPCRHVMICYHIALPLLLLSDICLEIPAHAQNPALWCIADQCKRTDGVMQVCVEYFEEWLVLCSVGRRILLHLKYWNQQCPPRWAFTKCAI